MSNVNFVTNGKKIYTLADNDWYAAFEDDEKVMLVDTDCKIQGNNVKTPWSYAKTCYDTDATNGQCILDYTNKLADRYFSLIKHAIIPRNVDCLNRKSIGEGKLENALVWTMSYEEFAKNPKVGDVIVRNTDGCIWTRTFSETYFRCNCAVSVCISNASLNSSSDSVTIGLAVAPAFYLRKSAIDRITEDGEIVLKSATEVVTNN